MALKINGTVTIENTETGEVVEDLLIDITDATPEEVQALLDGAARRADDDASDGDWEPGTCPVCGTCDTGSDADDDTGFCCECDARWALWTGELL